MKKHRRILSLALALVFVLGVTAVPAEAVQFKYATSREADAAWAQFKSQYEFDYFDYGPDMDSPYGKDAIKKCYKDTKDFTITLPDGTFEIWRHVDTGVTCNVDVYYPDGTMETVTRDDPAPSDGPVINEIPVETPMPYSLDADGDPAFVDVPEDAWYAEAVNAVAKGGLMNGTGNGCFNPEGELTYGELAAVIARLYLSKDTVYKAIPDDGNVAYGNIDSAYGCRLVSTAHHDEKLISNKQFRRAPKYPPSHWASFWNRYLTCYVLDLAEVEDLDVPAIRGSAISQIAYAAMYATSGAPEYVNHYTPDDIPDWDDVLGVKHTVLHSDTFLRCDARPMTIHVWPIDDELHFLPDAEGYVSHWSHLPEEHGYNMEWVEQNDLNGQTYVMAQPDLILRAYNMGLVSGVDAEGTCDVYGHLTRAELAVMLYRAGLTEMDCCNWPKDVGSSAGHYPEGYYYDHVNAQYYKDN